MKKFLSLFLAATLALVLFVPVSEDYAPVVSVTAQAASVTKPVASVKSGTYSVSPSTGMTVDISCSDESAQVYYSINGAAYKKAAYGYLDCIKIMKNTTLKLYSKTSKGTSAVVTYTYKLKTKLKFSTKSTAKGKIVTITPNTGAGVTLYYTTDGTKPTTKSLKYSLRGITLPETTTLKVLAVKNGWTNSYTTKKITVAGSGSSSGSGSGSDSGSTSNKFTSPKTGKSFTIPKEGYAQVSLDGTVNTVPAEFKTHEATQYWNYDSVLSVYLDGGIGNASNKYVFFNLTQETGNWSKGKTFTKDDLSAKSNYAGVYGVCKYYMSYLRRYSNTIETLNTPSNFDELMFKIIDVDKSGKSLKYYFYTKIHDSSSSHIIEGVVNVVKDAKSTASNDSNSGSTGNNNNTVTPNPVTPPIVTTPQKCAVCHGTGICSVCDGTGKVWGWKQKVTCTNCHGTRKCPFCKNGYIN